MPITLEKTRGEPLEKALEGATLATKIQILEELMALYTDWMSMVGEVLVGPHGVKNNINVYRVDAYYKIIKTMEKVYATGDVYKSLDDLIRSLTQE